MTVNTTVLPFGEFEGKKINKYAITEQGGIQVCVINYGATVTNIKVLDNTGIQSDVVLGFNTIDGYINAGKIYMGGICGRYANRLAKAEFSINDNKYLLTKNNGNNCLHGGLTGFDKVYWNATLLQKGNGVRFSYTSKDNEEGFPGNLKVTVIYRVLDNALHIEYNAVTDKSTPVNLTSHCYFNLSGGKETNILNHELQLNADSYVDVDDESIPTGKIISVKNTAMDFTTLKKIGLAISEVNGYDHSWVLNKTNEELINAALLVHKENGIKMTVYTTEPAIHFYSGNFLDGTLMNSKNGKLIQQYAGLCLETQHFPDSPNNNHFPDTILYPGEQYRQKTIYKFENEINN